MNLQDTIFIFNQIYDQLMILNNNERPKLNQKQLQNWKNQIAGFLEENRFTKYESLHESPEF
jgi:hypothetical protein